MFYLLGPKTGDNLSPTEAVIYSAGALLTVSFGELDPKCWFTQLLTLIESGFGVVLLGLFLWTLGNTGGRS
ncbi:MAG: hypothetical protein QOF01_2640 [Thermomicrobiales bacterium]|jgi:hypothetical protein|nr:hypothetical protein [Thermomicrobiales bacterium]